MRMAGQPVLSLERYAPEATIKTELGTRFERDLITVTLLSVLFEKRFPMQF
jgi:hypothetical protein